MLGIIVQLTLSWLIVRLIEKRSLSVLGFRPTKGRLAGFLAFFLLTGAFCASGFLMKMYFGHQQWRLNPKLSAGLVLNGIWWNIKSVLFEELIFRGVLLYILIQRLGALRAILISAAAFGIYHWFSFGVIGNPVAMAVTFLITGAMGVVLAYGYAKTCSLYLPFGIHFGWNLTQIFLFSGGPIGDGILVPNTPGGFRTDSLPVYILVTFMPLLLALVVNYALIRRRSA